MPGWRLGYCCGPEEILAQILDLSNKVIVSLTGNVVKGEVLIDFTQIPLNKQKFKITARLYDKELPSKEFQDLEVFAFQDVDIYNFQDQ
jgi:hypothetical protein